MGFRFQTTNLTSFGYERVEKKRAVSQNGNSLAAWFERSSGISPPVSSTPDRSERHLALSEVSGEAT